MNKRTIRIIILLSAFSLISLTCLQMYWIKNAFKLSVEQYNLRVSTAFRSILVDFNKMYEFDAVFISDKDSLSEPQKIPFKEMINLDKLDSLLKVRFFDNALDTVFTFNILNDKGDSVIYAKDSIIPRGIGADAFRIGGGEKYETIMLIVFFPHKEKFVYVKMMGWLAISLLFLLISTFSMMYILSTLFKHKKITEMKNDFINNMTHEFKTPIATISLASEVMLNSENELSKEKAMHYIKIISEENQRLKLNVERVLQTALLDKQNYTLKKKEVDIHGLIEQTVKNMCLSEMSKDVSVNYDFQAVRATVLVDKLHITNVIANLVENACKYSLDRPEILISTKNKLTGVEISFADNGIGMTAEAQKQVFQKFYRVPMGNIHNVKGFGLGLFYVKTLIEAHGGYIKVNSELGKGSKFDIFIPFKSDSK